MHVHVKDSSGHLVKKSILTLSFHLNISLDMCLSEALTCVYFYRSCCNLVCSKSVEKSLESEYKSFQNVETIARNLVKIYDIHDKLIIIN